MENIFGSNEVYLPKGKFESLTLIQKRDLDQVGILTSNGVPLLATIVAFHRQFASIRAALKGAGTDQDMANIKGLQEHERLTSYQIKNQRELGQLIVKDIAKVRVAESLSSYQQMTQLFLKQVSIVMGGDTRKNEELLTRIWNTLFARIEEDIVSLKEWEEDGSLRLLATRVVESRKEIDPDEELKKRDWDSDPLDEIDKEYEEDEYGYSDEAF